MTYSLAVTGARADQINQVENLTLADSAVQGTATVTIPTPGGMQQAMAMGYQFLAKGPDGAERLYRLDAERSTPTVPILLPVG
jgi:hypothetical protein